MARTVQWEQDSNRSTTSGGHSERSYETAPTEYSTKPSLLRNGTCLGRLEGHPQEHFLPNNDCTHVASYTARSSVDTYASTSEEDVVEEFDTPEYLVPQYNQYNHEATSTNAIPTTPRDFADLFPTAKRISIRHDDSTIDGNMNLRVDTQVEELYSKKQSYTLFHLRMHDLRTREFSLRRYCRDSGREVCHSIRKYQKPPAEKRPVLQRASTALASLRHKPESRPSTAAGLKRSDSGYESINGAGNEAEDEDDSRTKSTGYAKGPARMPTNTLKLEFSNYAHIDVKRRGAKGSKRYSFEYWGYNYTWKRIVNKDGDQESISYYLVRSDDVKEPLAHICPVRLTQPQAQEEKARGGWVPPCYMRITDEDILRSNNDISE
jgi:hypothetical protein